MDGGEERGTCRRSVLTAVNVGRALLCSLGPRLSESWGFHPRSARSLFTEQLFLGLRIALHAFCPFYTSLCVLTYRVHLFQTFNYMDTNTLELPSPG